VRVTFSNDVEAGVALLSLDGTDFEGRPLKVNLFA